MDKEYIENTLRESKFFIKKVPEEHYGVFLKDFIKFFDLKKEEFENLEFIKNGYSVTTPMQISLSLMKKIDEKVYNNKEESIKKFNDFIMVDLDKDLEDYKYIKLYINEF